MSATDYRLILDTLGGGFVSVECSDGEHVQLGVNIGMSVSVYIDLTQLDALMIGLMRARDVIDPPTHFDNELDRRPD